LEHLLSAWPKVALQLRDARHILLLTDYDGTLTPIVERPELANLIESTRLTLEALARLRGFRVGVISGRALTDLKDKVGIRGIIYAGNHGMEIEGPGISFVNPLAQEFRPLLSIVHYVLSRTVGRIKGVMVEDKGLSLSVHYRLVEEDKTEEVKDTFHRITGGAEVLGKIKITSGKKVYEVRPAVTWDKGKAVKLLMKRHGKGGRKSRLLPIYIGDDLTDEDGFKVIENYGNGLSVFVGEEGQHSAARYSLKSPTEVAAFLKLLLEQARRGFKP
jgi:trehalose 6-phosphate phosphatase